MVEDEKDIPVHDTVVDEDSLAVELVDLEGADGCCDDSDRVEEASPLPSRTQTITREAQQRTIILEEQQQRHRQEDDSRLPQHRQENDSLLEVPEPYTYEDTCRLAMRMGVLAIKYGTTSASVETFLSSLMDEFGYNGVFRVSIKEIFCTFQRHPEDFGGAHTQIVACQEGIHLHKLALLSDLVKDVKKNSLSPLEAGARLEAIDQVPNPWSSKQIAVAFFIVGASFAVVFEGGWWDILFGAMCGGLVFGVMIGFDALREDLHQWFPLTAAFLCSTLATVFKAMLPEVNAVLVTLSGLAVLLPGYSVSLGMAELVTSHILSGLNRLLKGAVVLLWLLTGSILGTRMVHAIPTVESAERRTDPVSKGWYAVFVPLLFCSASIILGNSHQDVPWAFLCMTIAYSTSMVASFVMEANFGTFLSSVAMTVFANMWANRMDRPNTLVLTPAFLVKVSGSIGFFGLVRIIEGETFVGTEQFLQMFLIALLIAAGMFAGNTLVPCKSSL